MRLYFLSLLSLVLSVSAFAGDSQKDLEKCERRVRDAGCYLSNKDEDRIEKNVEKCRQAADSDFTNEVFQLRQSGKVVVVKTKPNYGQYCDTTKYTLDTSGIKDFKVIGNSKVGTRIFALANAGRVYFMESDQETYEVLNSKEKSYSNVTEIKGDDSGTSIRIIGPGFDNKFTRAELREKGRKGQLRKLNFQRSSTKESLYRDK